jgi:hypothetical protein
MSSAWGTGARSEFLRGTEPIFVRRPVWAASGSPEFMSPHRDVSVAEGDDALPAGNPFSMPVGVLRVFEGQTRMLVPAQMIVLPMLLRNPMGVRGAVVQLSGPLMVLVVRSVVISRDMIRCSRSGPAWWASLASLVKGVAILGVSGCGVLPDVGRDDGTKVQAPLPGKQHRIPSFIELSYGRMIFGLVCERGRHLGKVMNSTLVSIDKVFALSATQFHVKD